MSKAPNGARVIYNQGELEWSDPNNCPDPDVQALLINRAKAFYREENNE